LYNEQAEIEALAYRFAAENHLEKRPKNTFLRKVSHSL